MYLGIDAGTSTIKATVLDADGHVVGSSEASYEASPISATNADFDPRAWWRGCRRIVLEAAASVGSAVRAIGIVGQMHGVVLLDRSGLPVRDAVLWPDRRAAEVLDNFRRFSDERPSVLRNPIVAGMAGPILAWLTHQEPDVVRAAAHAVQPKDFLRMQLGRSDACTDPSDASATLLYDISADRWSDALCDAVGIERSLLPPIFPSASVAASLRDDIADELGLRAGIPIVVGAGDAAAALLGAGLEQPGAVLINTGTGAQILTPTDRPIDRTPHSTGLHQYRSASTGSPWYAMEAVVNAGAALNWVRAIVGYDWDRLYSAGRLTDDADIARDPVFLPFLNDERDTGTTPSTGGAWVGLRAEHDRRSLARSAVRGVALYIALRAQHLLDHVGSPTVMLAGGAVRNRAWVELIADVVGVGLSVSSDPHLTVRGAAQLAALGVGDRLPVSAPQLVVEPQASVDRHRALEAYAATLRAYRAAASA